MIFFILIRQPSRSPLFPYTTLFRSEQNDFNSFTRDPKDYLGGETFLAESIRECQRVQLHPIKQRRILSARNRSEEHTSELQSRGHLVCRLLLEKKKYEMRTGFILKP